MDFARKLVILNLLVALVAPFWANAQQLPRPTEAQLAWHETEFYFFFHFGPNTFTDREWGHGDEPEDAFNPSALDCDQWCRIAKQAGARGVVITAKHHDGFCLWPSKFSQHTVRESNWRNGEGDVLRELSEAARRHGLKFGVYLSPWDRNHPKYGTPEYNDVYINTLQELMAQYGDLFEIWWDGANGEGPNGKRQVYDFHRFEMAAKKGQPNAVIFSDIGPGCRWAGNEQGTVNETNWCMLDTAGFQRGAGGPPTDTLQRGNENGKNWLPAECDVSIRPGWFYHAEEDSKVKTPEQLFEIYMKSVGRGANLILNVPPDRRGLIHEADSASLVAFGQKIRQAFSENLAAGQRVARLDSEGHKLQTIKTLTDENRRTFANGDEQKPTVFELDLGAAKRFNCIALHEFVEEGQRVRAFKIEIEEGEKWKEVARSTTIGFRKIVSFAAVEARKIRVTILDSKAAPLLSELRVFQI